MRVDAPNGLLHGRFLEVSSCNASTTQPFKHQTILNCMLCVKVMNVVNSLHDPNFTTVWSMSWPGSNQRQPLCLPSVLKPAPGNFGITLLGHAICTLETPQTWRSCNWDVLLAVSCAWAPCTPTSLPCSRKWVNTLLIRNAEAKAWTARMTGRASAYNRLLQEL